MSLKKVILPLLIIFMGITIGMENAGKLYLDAIKANNIDRIKQLIDQGADINAKWGPVGYTPLISATQHNNPKVIKLLLSVPGIDVNASDPILGNTPLIWATMYGLEALKQLLLDPRIDVNTENNKGATAFSEAIRLNKLEMIQKLLTHRYPTKASPEEIQKLLKLSRDTTTYFHRLPPDIVRMVGEYSSAYSISDDEAQKALDNPQVKEEAKQLIRKILEERKKEIAHL